MTSSLSNINFILSNSSYQFYFNNLGLINLFWKFQLLIDISFSTFKYIKTDDNTKFLI